MTDQTDEGTEGQSADQDLEAIRDAREEADDLVASIAKSNTTAKKDADAVSVAAADSRTDAERIAALKAEADALKARMSEDAATIEALRKQSKDDAETTADLSGSAAALEVDIADKRTRLNNLTEDVEKLSTRIESLLPGATSTGLAESFMHRRLEYRRPRFAYTLVTITSILSLAAVGLFGDRGFFDLVQQGDLSWGRILTGIAMRLPFAGPLVWLAIYSGRHQLLTTRLEEDYAYKEAVSRAFEGYRRQMEDVSVDQEDEQPVAVLCSNVLRTIGQDPGRLFDKRHRDFTPLNAALDSLDDQTLDSLAKRFEVSKDTLRGLVPALITAAAAADR